MTTREFQLLLACARLRPDPAKIHDLAGGEIDWRGVWDLASYHGVRPLVRRSLRSVCPDAVPVAIQSEWETFHRQNTQKSLLFVGELLRLLGAFERSGIEAAVFKGAVLAESVYGDLANREFCDLDIAVREADIRDAEHVLAACGYTTWPPPGDFRATFLAYPGQYTFRHAEVEVFVDLHWRLASTVSVFPLRLAELWPRLTTVTIAGRPARTFAGSDLALFLAAHGARECWRRLKWVCDFSELLHGGGAIDWNAVHAEAERLHATRSLLLAVHLASALLDAPAPAGLVDAAAKDRTVQALARAAERRLARVTPDGDAEELLEGLGTRDRLMDGLAPAFALLTTRTVGDYEALPLPRALWGLYYVTRPFRLAGKAVGIMLRKS